MSTSQIVCCFGAARFVREISPLIDLDARVRWIADLSALERNIQVAEDCRVCIVEHTEQLSGLRALELTKAKSPTIRRLVVVDACQLKTVRLYLESDAANEIVYRPLDKPSLLKSCGIVTPERRRHVSHA